VGIDQGNVGIDQGSVEIDRGNAEIDQGNPEIDQGNEFKTQNIRRNVSFKREGVRNSMLVGEIRN